MLLTLIEGFFFFFFDEGVSEWNGVRLWHNHLIVGVVGMFSETQLKTTIKRDIDVDIIGPCSSCRT